MSKAIIIIRTCIFLIFCVSEDICEKHYAFDFPTIVTPQDTFHLGDTIWYEINLPNQIIG